ncbi:Putrescine transport system permease protein PotH [Methylobacterium crusticola]|uniref:Putrescine transport system permease protein PotH n=1 Tax=Methylobacterium crusticola TaxID=1697972 RepID=A0ABQ4RAT5_9HYPH|nr:ABC transporter permease [Methylobacterium crusticola]GJD53980.1 Putrescine transport system permease protein PotH [Methylobacterium crusticola]
MTPPASTTAFLATAPSRRSLRDIVAGGAAPLLLLPAVLFVTILLIVPTLEMMVASVQTQDVTGTIGPPLTARHFVRLVDVPLYRDVLVATLRIAIVTAFLSALVGFPVAMVIARGHPVAARCVNVIIVMPLVVSIVVRAYGWQLILANGPNGVLNVIGSWLGLGRVSVRLLYSETAVVIGSLHVFLAMMVLPLASSLARIPRRLEEAAATLGASSLRIFWKVILPLSLPGLSVGLTLVFTLTASSFVLPVILGGNKSQMIGQLLEQQATAVFDWPFSAAIAIVMVSMIFGVNGLSLWFIKRQLSAGSIGVGP